MNSTFENKVTVVKCNRNQCVTNTNTYNVMSYMQKVTGYALIENAKKDDIFNVGTDVLDIVMRTFTMLAQMQQENTGGGSISIPIASWETACLIRGVSHTQFEQAKAYCNVLSIYTEKGSVLLLNTRHV